VRSEFDPHDILFDMAYRFSFTPEIVRALQSIERARAEVTLTVLPPAVAERLRLRARVKSTHFSTRIEGNRLTLAEAEQVVIEGRQFPDGKETLSRCSIISRRWRWLKIGWNRDCRLPRNASGSSMP